MANFEHDGLKHYWGLGINSKNSELHTAMGLCMLPKVKELIQYRKELSELYNQFLLGYSLTRPITGPETSYNYAYYPVLFSDEKTLASVILALNEQHIFP
ncbi:DegT/DnrJ/EryC1/StrS family aminotransferase [Hymenobacter volaticus]|uniref:DegT/DnrJ/EryC1/StrS family aminotransferase n=1 Tax=Hymenobacter volaticus TaxID=2932254 RepID=UPI0035CBC0E2